jgi:hypothetical protein
MRRPVIVERGIRYESLLVEADHAGVRAIATLVETGALRAHIEATFPFAKAAKAHAFGETGRTTGHAGPGPLSSGGECPVSVDILRRHRGHRRVVVVGKPDLVLQPVPAQERLERLAAEHDVVGVAPLLIVVGWAVVVLGTDHGVILAVGGEKQIPEQAALLIGEEPDQVSVAARRPRGLGTHVDEARGA